MLNNYRPHKTEWTSVNVATDSCFRIEYLNCFIPYDRLTENYNHSLSNQDQNQNHHLQNTKLSVQSHISLYSNTVNTCTIYNSQNNKQGTP